LYNAAAPSGDPVVAHAVKLRLTALPLAAHAGYHAA
jgi:hypothetical protein